MTIKEIINKVITWRLIILLFAIPGIFALGLRPGFTQLTPGFSFPNLINIWANFDGDSYLKLAEYGYSSSFTHTAYAFFPIFPWLIRIVNVFGSYLFSALIISHVSLVLALYFLWKLLRLDYSKKIVDTTLLLLMVFPTAFFFGSVYSESLFFLLSVLTFYSFRKGNFFLACFFAMIASVTRVVGIFLWPALLIELWHQYGKDWKKALNPQAVWLLLPPLGLLSYMRFLSLKTNNAFYFLTSQPLFGASRELDKIVLPHQVFYRYLRMIIFIDHTDPLFFTILLEFITGLGFLVLVVWGLKKLRPSYSIYTALAFALPALSGTFSGMPRYVLVLFPAFILMAEVYQKLPENFRKLYLAVSVLFSLIAVTLFSRGYFIG